MVKKIVSIVLVLALVFAGGYYTCLQLLPDETEEVTGPVYATKAVERGDIQVGVNITGQLDAGYGGSISAPSPEGIDGAVKYKVEEILVTENARINTGDKIMRLSSPNLPELMEKQEKAINEKQDKINRGIKDLGKLINKDISSIADVNPSSGVVFSSPIDGKIANLKVKQGEMITEKDIAKIVNDQYFKISFMLKPDEYNSLISNDKKIKVSFSGYDGYYDAEVSEISENAEATSITRNNAVGQKITEQVYVHTGVIIAKNPGIIQIGTNAGVYLDMGSSLSSPFSYSGEVESYLDESTVYSMDYISTEDKTYIATEVFVKNGNFVKAGDPIVRIAGSDVTTAIQSKINEIEQAQRELQDLREQMNKFREFAKDLTVYSPSDGIVSYMQYMVGDEFSVSPGGDRWESQVCGIYNVNEMYIDTTVSDLDVIYVQVDSEVEVTVDALAGQKFKGVVDRVRDTVRDGKTTYRVSIRVEGGEGLRPGMNCNCFIDAGKSENTLLVPIEAVFEDDYKQKVEILKEDGTVEAVEIEIGLMNDRYVEVLSGLEEGQLVVTGSTQDLMPSQSVEKSNSLLPTNNN